MKLSYLLTILLLYSLNASAKLQTKFFNCSFGDSKEQVANKMRINGYTPIKGNEGLDTTVMVIDGKPYSLRIMLKWNEKLMEQMKNLDFEEIIRRRPKIAEPTPKDLIELINEFEEK